jgi:DNA polymerase III alpha subunit
VNQLASGLVYYPDLNKLFYSNDFIMNSGMNLQHVSDKLGVYAEYISDDERDLLYAKSLGIKIFDEKPNEFDYKLSGMINLDVEIKKLVEEKPDFEEFILEEYDYIKNAEHNLLLLKIAFLLKRHLDSKDKKVYLMRGSGISSFIFYAMGLNKVNPLKFELDYRNFWNN